MLRIYFLQQWFNLADPAVEEALYDSIAMRRFVGIDLGREPASDETTVCRFCYLFEARDPERHQTKKGKRWDFGMKAYLGVDSRTKLIPTAVATPANIAGSTVLPELLPGNETQGASRPIAASGRCTAGTLRGPRISSTVAIAIAASWTRANG